MDKCYSRLESFDGNEGKWKEWYFQFGVATKACDMATGTLMEEVEKLVLTEAETEK